MLEQNKAAQPSVETQLPFLTKPSCGEERQTLPKSTKEFVDFMYPVNASEVPEINFLKIALESNFSAATTDTEESLPEDMVLNQLSASTGSEVFDPVNSVLMNEDVKSFSSEISLDLSSSNLVNESYLVQPTAVTMDESEDLLVELGDDSVLLNSLNIEKQDAFEELDDLAVTPVLGVSDAIKNPIGLLNVADNLNYISKDGANGAKNVQDPFKDAGLQTRAGIDNLVVKADRFDKPESTSSSSVSTTNFNSSSASSGFSQGSGMLQGQALQNQMMFAQMQQNQRMSEQMIKTQILNENMGSKVGEVSGDKEKSAGLLAGLGGALDKSGQLLTGLQAINTPVKHPQWGQALGQRIVSMANSQMQEAKIMLNPEKLGPIQIKLSLDKDQQIHVAMYAQQGTTREAMENALPKLREMLEQAGINFGSLDVADQNKSEQKQHNDESSEEIGEEELAVDSLTEKDATTLVIKTANLVDYYA